MSNSNIDFAIEAEFSSGVWTDITEDVIDSNARAEYGIRGSTPIDRIASTGQMFFELNNSENNSARTQGYYSPGTYQCRAGFDTGIRVRAIFIHEGNRYIKFVGRIPKDGISVEPGVWDKRTVSVEVRDWMEQAAVHEIRGQDVKSWLRADQALNLLIAPMPLQPDNTDFDTGTDVYPIVFDKTQNNAVVMSEANRLVMSELGYLYIKYAPSSGETLRFENRFSRYLSQIVTIPIPVKYAAYITDEDDNFLMDEDNNYIVEDAVDTLDMQYHYNVFPTYGSQIYNRVKSTVYPRSVDTIPAVLATLQSVLYVGAGQSITIQIQYRDPSNKATNVAGFNMLSPDADDGNYTFNAAQNGGGNDMTSDLIVTPAYSATYVDVTFTNSAAIGGYVTYYEAKGYGIYTYDTVSYTAEDIALIALNGAEALSLDLAYQIDPIIAVAFSEYFLAEYKYASASLQWVEFIANFSGLNEIAFLIAEPGARVSLTEEISGVSHEFFINGCGWEHKTGIIKYKWYVSATSDILSNWAVYDEDVYDDTSVGYAL